MTAKEITITAVILGTALTVILCLIVRFPSGSFRGGQGVTWPTGEKYLPIIPR